MLGRVITLVLVALAVGAAASAQDVRMPEIEFGRYHALVIGNNDYKHLPKLQTAVSDAERATFQLPANLVERARDAVYWTPGATMAGLVEAALSVHLGKLEKKRGEPFPERAGALRTGRPVK